MGNSMSELKPDIYLILQAQKYGRMNVHRVDQLIHVYQISIELANSDPNYDRSKVAKYERKLKTFVAKKKLMELKKKVRVK